MALARDVFREFEVRSALLEEQGLGAQAARLIAEGELVAIRCWDYSSIRPIEEPFRHLRALRALERLQARHPGAHPYYLFDFHVEDEDEAAASDEYSDEVSLLFAGDDEGQWEREREALAAGRPRAFAVRFFGDELFGGDGDCLDFLASLTPWHSGVGRVLELNLEEELSRAVPLQPGDAS